MERLVIGSIGKFWLVVSASSSHPLLLRFRGVSWSVFSNNYRRTQSWLSCRQWINTCSRLPPLCMRALSSWVPSTVTWLVVVCLPSRRSQAKIHSIKIQVISYIQCCVQKILLQFSFPIFLVESVPWFVLALHQQPFSPWVGSALP